MRLDPYIEPRTGVLKNKLDATSKEELCAREYALTAIRADELEKKPIKGNFDMAHICAIHKHLFQDVYDWAGKPRIVNLSKDGDPFCPAINMEAYMSDVHRRLAKQNYLRGLDKNTFIDKLADYFGEINALHPFREGNGRAARIFIGQLVKEAGYYFDQTKINTQTDAWISASKKAHWQNLDEIRAIFKKAICSLSY